MTLTSWGNGSQAGLPGGGGIGAGRQDDQNPLLSSQ